MIYRFVFLVFTALLNINCQSTQPQAEHYTSVPYINIEEGSLSNYKVCFPPKAYRKNPEVVRTIAIDFYRMMEDNFPVSIADNFKEGISTEHIHYPTLFIQVELFKNKDAQTPYAKQKVKVWEEKGHFKAAIQ